MLPADEPRPGTDKNPLLPGKPNEIPDDQEVVRESHALDDVELVGESRGDFAETCPYRRCTPSRQSDSRYVSGVKPGGIGNSGRW